jgi:L-amino acid N-acyltransferase YncA
LILRPYETSDAPAVAAIYGHHVIHGLGTFEETPPSDTEMAQRAQSVLALGLPYLVAEDGDVVGFAYAGAFRPRAAYRYAVEDSVYVAASRTGRGVGKALLRGVIDRCEALGLRQMIAVIGDSGNAGSISLHRSLGFDHRGILTGVGFKHDRWVDVVWMQRTLGAGDEGAPDRGGLTLPGA